MKKRIGFVSNSSSSSFVLGIKELKEETILKFLKVSKDSPLYPLASSIARQFFNKAEKVTNIELQEWKEDGTYQKSLEYCKSHGLKIYTGSIEDNEDNDWVCALTLEIKNKFFYLLKDGGY